MLPEFKRPIKQLLKKLQTHAPTLLSEHEHEHEQEQVPGLDSKEERQESVGRLGRLGCLVSSHLKAQAGAAGPKATHFS